MQPAGRRTTVGGHRCSSKGTLLIGGGFPYAARSSRNCVWTLGSLPSYALDTARDRVVPCTLVAGRIVAGVPRKAFETKSRQLSWTVALRPRTKRRSAVRFCPSRF